MRLNQLKIGAGGDELTLGFHERLTVVGGMHAADRSGFVDLLVNALVGRGDDTTELAMVDHTGRPVTVSHDGHGLVTRTGTSDGAPVADPLESIGLTSDAFRALVHVRAEELRVITDRPDVQLPPEVSEAHAALAQADADLVAAAAARERAADLARAMAEVDGQLAGLDDARARRRFLDLLSEIDRVRAEAEAVAGGREGAEADDRLIAAAAEMAPIAHRWREIEERLLRAVEEFGDRPRLDADTLRAALAAPDHLPDDLDQLSRAVEEAERDRDRVAGRLAALAHDQLPTPSQPAVARLARADQETVWATCRAATAAVKALDHASIELGGLGSEAALVAEIETAHQAVEQAEADVENTGHTATILAGVGVVMAAVAAFLVTPLAAPAGLVPLLSALIAWHRPRRRLARAQAREQAVLESADVSSYLAFHIRRVDATLDPAIRERHAQNVARHSQTLATWMTLAGDLTPGEALELEPEVRAFASALYGLEGAAEEIETLQRELTDRAEPALDAARAALLAACAPFGTDDPVTAAETVRRLAEASDTAHRQADLEELEEDAATLRHRVGALLDAAGFADDDTALALSEFESASAAAADRARAREGSRPADVVHADLARLEARAGRERRPEWGDTIAPVTAADLDADALLARRAELEATVKDLEKRTPDLARLRDRRDTLARRVAVVEAEAGVVTHALTRADVEPQLVSRIDGCRRPGDDGNLVAFMDEPLAGLAPADKWALLSVIEEAAETVQVIYLTEDPDVIVWARRRAGTDSLTLLEPVAEPV